MAELVDARNVCRGSRLLAVKLIPVRARACPRIINLKLNLMAKESEERKKVKEKLIKKNDKLPFSLSLYVKVSRMVQDLNRLARANRLVEPEDVLYSIQQEGAPKGKFYVVRNY